MLNIATFVYSNMIDIVYYLSMALNHLGCQPNDHFSKNVNDINQLLGHCQASLTIGSYLS